MKILIVNFEYPPLGGGGGVATKQIAERLSRRHEVHVITTKHGELKEYEQKGTLHVHRVPVIGRKNLPTASLLSMLTFVPSALKQGVHLLRRQNFDVINAQFVLPSGLPAALLAKIFKVPFVLSFIGGDIYDPTKGSSPHRFWILRWLIRNISKHAVAHTAISEDTKTRARKLHGVKEDITVTHLGIDPMTVNPVPRQQLNLHPDTPLFITIGRLIPRKGYRDLLSAWAQVPSAHLLILGSGPQANELKQIINANNLAPRVHLMGFVSEDKKQQLLLAADAYISAATHEGFGLVFLEAMDAGLPIIAANVGGHTDFLEDMENALLVKPHEPSQLAKAATSLIENKQLADAISQNNKVKVKKFYLDNTAKIFEDILISAAKPER